MFIVIFQHTQRLKGSQVSEILESGSGKPMGTQGILKKVNGIRPSGQIIRI